jgi:hypothetical protein
VSQKFLSSLTLVNLGTDPSSPSIGELYYNTGSNLIKFYNGSSWASLSSAAGGATLGANTFTSTQTITPSTSVTSLILNAAESSIGIVVKANATTPGDIQQWQVSDGTPVAKVSSVGNVTATSFVTSGGVGTQFLKGDGTLDSTVYLPASEASTTYLSIANAATTYSPQEIIPLDNLKYWFDGLEDRFYPTYQGEVVTVGNPNRVEITVNGLQQPIYTPDYVWGTPFSGDGFMIDSEGYIAFSEVPPAGSTFSGKILPGAVTSSLDNRYPFKAQDLLLGAY